MSNEPRQPIINITGERVAVGPLRRDLLPLYQKWINDFAVTRTLAVGWAPVTREAEEAWYDRASASGSADISFTIYERATLRPVGNTSLNGIDYQHGAAEFGIMIGEPDCWGKGYGTETARLMLDYGFTALGLHNVMLWVDAHNERGIRAYTRAGFKPIGRRREVRGLGGLHDELFMDCISTEFTSPTLAALLPPNDAPRSDAG